MRTLTSLAAVCGVAIVLLFNPTLPPLHRFGAAPALRVSSSEEGGTHSGPIADGCRDA